MEDDDVAEDKVGVSIKIDPSSRSTLVVQAAFKVFSSTMSLWSEIILKRSTYAPLKFVAHQSRQTRLRNTF
jgi:hypothetical protein